jgi:hypothetical protein
VSRRRSVADGTATDAPDARLRGPTRGPARPRPAAADASTRSRVAESPSPPGNGRE